MTKRRAASRPSGGGFAMGLSRWACLLCAWALPLASHAADLQGRLSADLYTYERGDSTHVRPYFRLSGTWGLWRAPGLKSISLHTSFRWTTDFGDKSARDPQWYVYDTYLALARLVPGLNIDVGRQYAYVGIGGAHLDGVHARYDRPWFLAEAYAGSRVNSLDPERVRSASDFGAVGAQLVGKLGKSLRLGAHFAGFNDGGSLAREQAGASGEFQGGPLTLYGLYVYDLVSRSGSSLLTRVRYADGPWAGHMEYATRKPVVFANSLFSMINASAYDEYRVGVQRRLRGTTSLVTGASATDMDGAWAWRGRLGITSPRYSLFGLAQWGDQGDLLGLQGMAAPWPERRLQPYARFAFNRYAVQEEQTTDSDAHTLAAGALARMPGNRSLRAEAQWLSNAVESGSWRLYVQYVQGFSLMPTGGGTRP